MWKQKKQVIVCGCGRFGACIARQLSKAHFDVTAIDLYESAFDRLQDDFEGFEIIGDGSDPEILEHAGIRNCDLLLAATEDDNVNAMIAQIAVSIYHVKEVYLRFQDPTKEKLLEDCSLHAIYPANLSVQEFERLSHIKLQEKMEGF